MGKSAIELDAFFNVGHNGIEPLTSFLSGKRSTTELVTQRGQKVLYHGEIEELMYYECITIVPSSKIRTVPFLESITSKRASAVVG